MLARPARLISDGYDIRTGTHTVIERAEASDPVRSDSLR